MPKAARAQSTIPGRRVAIGPPPHATADSGRLANIQILDHPSDMSPFDEIDSVIEACAASVGSTLLGERLVDTRRWFHLPGDPPFECFQIVVWPPSNGKITVQAGAIDTNDNTEREMIDVWEGPIIKLASMLDNALATVEGWKARPRTKPAPPSLW